MVLADMRTFLGYRFEVRFWASDVAGRDEIPDYRGTGWAFGRIKHRPEGLEFTTAHAAGAPILYAVLREARVVEITISDYHGQHHRLLTYKIGRPQALTIELDAMSDAVATNGILFRDVDLISLENTQDPPTEKA